MLVPRNCAIDDEGVSINAPNNVLDISKPLAYQPLAHLSRADAMMTEYQRLSVWVKASSDLVRPLGKFAQGEILEAFQMSELDFLRFSHIYQLKTFGGLVYPLRQLFYGDLGNGSIGKLMRHRIY
jgi:hypothetical protein